MKEMAEKASAGAAGMQAAAGAKMYTRNIESHVKKLAGVPSDEHLAKARESNFALMKAIDAALGLYRTWSANTADGLTLPALGVLADHQPALFLGTTEQAKAIQAVAAHQAEVNELVIGARRKYGKFAVTKLIEALKATKATVKLIVEYEKAEIQLSKAQEAIKSHEAKKGSGKPDVKLAAKLEEAEHKVKATKASAEAEHVPMREKAEALVGEALDFVLVGYDKVCVLAEAVYTETPREVLEAYKPKSAVTTSGGAMQNMIAKKPTSDKEVLEDTSRLIKLASDQLKAFHAKGLLTTNGPPKEFELVSALGAAVHGKAVKQQVSSITGEISRMDEGRNDFAKGVALATTNAIEVEATRCNGEVLAWKFVQKLEKEIEKTKAALLKEKAEAKLEMLKAMLAESEAKLQGKQAEWDRAMAAFRAPETSIAAGVLKATESYGKAVLQLCVARGKNGAYAKWLEYLASKGLTEETYTLAEAVEEADIDETAGEAAPDDMGAEIKKA